MTEMSEEAARNTTWYGPQVLDPACGSGAFLAHAEDVVVTNPPYGPLAPDAEEV